jgi:hypothetical protein
MKLISIILFLFFYCLAEGQTYTNKNGDCRLVLSKDLRYKYKYPTFLSSQTESGSYTVYKDSLLLRAVVKNKFDSLEYWTYYLEAHPDSVEFSFRNLNDSAAELSFSINNSQAVFKTDKNGKAALAYSELLKNKIISTDSAIVKLKIKLGNKTYVVNGKFLKPGGFETKLNHYLNEKDAILYRKFYFKNDSVIVNGISRKVIGQDVILSRK